MNPKPARRAAQSSHLRVRRAGNVIPTTSARDGISLVEVLVAGSLVCVIASLVGVIHIAGQKATMQVRHMRLATDEANNQISRLVMVPPGDMNQLCKEVHASDELRSVFPDAKTVATLGSDETMRWVNVEVRWGERPGELVSLSAPIELSVPGASPSPPAEAESPTETELPADEATPVAAETAIDPPTNTEDNKEEN